MLNSSDKTTTPSASTAKKPIPTNAAASCSGSIERRRQPHRHVHRSLPATPAPTPPHNRYNIDPRELVRIQREGRDRGEDIVGFYHSHPDHPAQWSSTDLAEAHWFGCSYVITSVEKGKAAITNSFELTGTDETDKRLVDEPIEVS